MRPLSNHPSSGHPLCNRRKAAEQTLREREAGLAHAQSIANLGSWASDLQTGAETWSDEIYRIFSFAPRTFQPTRQRFLERVHPDDLERARQRLQDVIDWEPAGVRPGVPHHTAEWRRAFTALTNVITG